MGRPRKPKPEPEIEALQAAEAAKSKSADTAIAVISAGKLKKLLASHRAAKRDLLRSLRPSAPKSRKR